MDQPQKLFWFDDVKDWRGYSQLMRGEPRMKEHTVRVSGFRQVAAHFGFDTGSQEWDFLERSGPPTMQLPASLRDLPRDYTSLRAAASHAATGGANPVGNYQVWKKALKQAAAAAASESTSSSHKSAAQSTPSEVVASAPGEQQGQASRFGDAVARQAAVGGSSGSAAAETAVDAAALEGVSDSSFAAESAAMQQMAEMRKELGSLRAAQVASDQKIDRLSADVVRAESQLASTEREAVEARKTAADAEAIAKAAESAAAESLHNVAVEFSKELNTRRHTGSRSSHWTDKKRQRAERFQSGGGSSSSMTAEQRARMCVVCLKGEMGAHCSRSMCRPCCMHEYSVSNFQRICPQHQSQATADAAQDRDQDRASSHSGSTGDWSHRRWK